MANWSQSNWSLKSWNNRARSFVGRDPAAEAAAEAERLAQEAAAQARRDADTLAREVDEHSTVHALKAYRKAQMARATAAMQQSPEPAPLPAQTADVVPDPALVRAAVERMRAPRARAPGGDTGLFTGGIRL